MEIEFIPAPDTTPEQIDERRKQLEAKGAKVIVRPHAVDAGISDSRVNDSKGNPLEGHPEILSATVNDNAAILVIAANATTDDATLAKIGLELAKAHGSPAKQVVVRKATV